MPHRSLAFSVLFVLLLLCLVRVAPAAAQITPPGMGDADVAAWSAVGLRESIGSERSYLGYVGVGAVQDRHDGELRDTPGIFVFNHELYHRFHPGWLYSVGLSYRRQHAREGEQLARRDELRVYARYARVVESHALKLQLTLRPELRGFLRPGFEPAEEALELRARAKTQLVWRMDTGGAHRLIGAAEALSALSRHGGDWGTFGYRESRFSLFYSVLCRERMTFEVGYMNQLVGSAAPLADVHYLAVDVVWQDLLGAHGG